MPARSGELRRGGSRVVSCICISVGKLTVQCREGGPTIFAQVKNGKGMDHIVSLVLSAWRSSGAAAGSANGAK